MDDPFHVLNLHRSASQDEIKKRYLTLAKQWHPDTQYSKDELSRIEAERQFKRIQQAFTLASRKHQVPGHYPNPYVSINMPVNEHYRCCLDDVSNRVWRHRFLLQATQPPKTPHAFTNKQLALYFLGVGAVSTVFVVSWNRMVASRRNNYWYTSWKSLLSSVLFHDLSMLQEH